jgi:hypothetical protein
MINDYIMIKITEEKIGRNELEHIYNQNFFEITNKFLEVFKNYYDFGVISEVSSASTPEIISETIAYFRFEENDDFCDFSAVSSGSPASTPEIIDETIVYFRFEENGEVNIIRFDSIDLLDKKELSSPSSLHSSN